MPDEATTEEELPNEEESSEARGLPGSEEFPSEDKIEADINVTGADVSISPLDPDFLFFALPLAFAVDSLDIILEITGHIVVIPKIIGIAIDFVTLIILGSWLYWRTGKIAQSKEDYVTKLREAAQKGTKQLSKLQKLGKVSPKVFDRYMRLYAKQMGKIERAAAKAATKPLARTLIRGGLTFLGEVVPLLIGLIPFWIIMVLLSLREE